MKYADWRHIAIVCAVLGFLLLVGGVIAYLYGETAYFLGYPITTYPYRDYAPLPIILGGILIVIGIESSGRAEEEKKEVETPKPVPVSLKKCPKCGMEFSPEYGYCPICGAKLESA